VNLGLGTNRRRWNVSGRLPITSRASPAPFKKREEQPIQPIRKKDKLKSLKLVENIGKGKRKLEEG
jgi:hypothetical protein